MTPAAIEAAALHLLAARRLRRPGARLPKASRPTTSDEAFAIQRRIALLLDEPIGGWKCSLPTDDRMLAAPIYTSTIVRTPPCAVPPLEGYARIEPEIAFVLAKDLPGRAAPYDEQEVRAAIGETRLVLELLGSRYANPARVPPPEMLADGANNYGLFVGPVVSKALERNLDAVPLRITSPAGAILAREGVHPDGHPLRPLVWLANWFGHNPAGWKQGLAAGQIVTTGSYAGALDVPMATPLTVTFGDLGKVEVTLIPVA
jgi:2-keto-4-pentenoate hydratase